MSDAGDKKSTLHFPLHVHVFNKSTKDISFKNSSADYLVGDTYTSGMNPTLHVLTKEPA